MLHTSALYKLYKIQYIRYYVISDLQQIFRTQLIGILIFIYVHTKLNTLKYKQLKRKFKYLFVLIARHTFTSVCALHYVIQNTCFDVLQFLHETSLIQARIQGYINVNILWSSSKMPDIFVRF